MGAIKSTDKNSTVQLSLPITVKSKKTDVSQSEAGIHNMSDFTPITTFTSLPGEGLPGQDDHQTWHTECRWLQLEKEGKKVTFECVC